MPVDMNSFVQSSDDEGETDDTEDGGDTENSAPMSASAAPASAAPASAAPMALASDEPPLITISKLLLPTVPLLYDAMKVDELRKTVVDQSLVTKDEAKKLKKNELLALLKK